ncbi:glycosyltransferase family 2 protein [Patescibacteria group bacterium]|nr:glycosyltransferase family 2 protein [Patescibacteria group bacterium]
MDIRISVVINTLNEERNIEKALESVKWADEIIVCDMYSEDKTVEIAKKLGAKILFHKKEEFVEQARNYAISKVSNEWTLVLDADEEIPESLAKKLTEISSKMNQIDYARIPRKNLIFGHFMQATGWWPDYNIRFFKKGIVQWGDKIHRPPEASGQGLDLPAEEKYAIVHHSYRTISQFIERMNRYSNVQARELKEEGAKFNWRDLFEKPLSEFLSRFFANRGYEDGLHGLTLSFLQAFSSLVMYLKLWESNNFKEQDIDLTEVKDQKDKSAEVFNYWINKSKYQENFFQRLFKKIRD